MYSQELLVVSAATASGLPGLANWMPLRLVCICCKKTAFPRGRKGAVECLLDCRCRRRCGCGVSTLTSKYAPMCRTLVPLATTWASPCCWCVEAYVAAEAITGELLQLAAAAFNALVISSVAYIDPEMGLTEDKA